MRTKIKRRGLRQRRKLLGQGKARKVRNKKFTLKA